MLRLGSCHVCRCQDLAICQIAHLLGEQWLGIVQTAELDASSVQLLAWSRYVGEGGDMPPYHEEGASLGALLKISSQTAEAQSRWLLLFSTCVRREKNTDDGIDQTALGTFLEALLRMLECTVPCTEMSLPPAVLAQATMAVVDRVNEFQPTKLGSAEGKCVARVVHVLNTASTRAQNWDAIENACVHIAMFVPRNNRLWGVCVGPLAALCLHQLPHEDGEVHA